MFELLLEPLKKYVRVDGTSDRMIITASRELVEVIVTEIRLIDRPRRDQTVFLALSYISAPSAFEMLPARLQPFVRIDSERDSVAITGSDATREEVVALLRRLDRPLPPRNTDTRQVYDTVIVKLDHIKAQTVMNLLPEAYTAFVRSDDASNAISVNAPPSTARQILADLAEFDRPRNHIMLEAKVVVLDSTALLNLGLEFQPPGLTAGFNRVDGGTDISEIAIGYTNGRSFTNALGLTLNLLAENSQASIVASPQVLAQDGIESEIRVTTAEFFQILTETGTTIRSDLEEIETGTILRIVPQVGLDGTLTLAMELEVSDVIARGEQNLPVVNRRTVTNTVQIEDGGTAAVAGLADARNTRTRQGLPGLMNLPFFGRSDSVRSASQQLAIFVTATIVNSDEDQFQTGRKRPPSLGAIDETLYRAELRRVLDSMAY